VAGRRAGGGGSWPGRMVVARARAGGRGHGGVGLGGLWHLAGLKRLVGQNGVEEFKRKLSWAAKAIGLNSRMGCRNSFQEFGCKIKGFKLVQTESELEPN
jgi:hypothetical protein